MLSGLLRLRYKDVFAFGACRAARYPHLGLLRLVCTLRDRQRRGATNHRDESRIVSAAARICCRLRISAPSLAAHNIVRFQLCSAGQRYRCAAAAFCVTSRSASLASQSSIAGYLLSTGAWRAAAVLAWRFFGRLMDDVAYIVLAQIASRAGSQSLCAHRVAAAQRVVAVSLRLRITRLRNRSTTLFTLPAQSAL